MSDEKIYSEPSCGCYRGGYVARVVECVGYTYSKACHAAEICKEARPATLEECILALVTLHATAGTIIESGSQEALWETERILNGIETRLLARIRDYYKKVLAMSSEERQKWLAIARRHQAGV